MVKITSQEIEHLAKISRIKMERDEIEQLATEIEAVLEYASSLHEVAKQSIIEEEEHTGTNVMREDVAVKEDRESLLEAAPDREGDFFVVPKIIKQK